MNKNLRNIWSINIVIENYKTNFPDNYNQYKTLIHNVIKENVEILRNNIFSSKVQNLPELQDFVYEINSKINFLINGNIKKIVNATGVIINTNFGRSPISLDTLKSISDINSNYFNLEYDIKNSKRGSRQDYIEYLFQLITGAESSFVVNNNASSLFLVCNTFSKNKKVLASRGELIEIGDSFRLTDIIESSQAILKEVGTTNKTYISDYEKNIDQDTSILLKSHTSNYNIVGFTENVSSKSLSKLAKEKGLISFEDIGSGYLFDLNISELKDEPNAKNKINDGIDLVCFSGDKILGSIQAGIIVGKKKLIDEIKRNPIARAMRIDKVSLTILENTLRIYLSENNFIIDKTPILKMITLSYETLYERVLFIKNELSKIIDNINIIDDYSQVGGGSLPTNNILTPVLEIKSNKISNNKLFNKLKNSDPSIIGILKNDSLIINLRTVFEDQDKLILDFLKNIMKNN